ncbi:hypothetical protein KAI04_04795 [Candidatus Pacearchaeota archaeon]|nr:hypothetical protein [Candidatus Pacearchaeota archaeon]
MTVNPEGFIQVYDFGNPKVITGKARETISGGQFVGVSGATGVVTSGTSSFLNTDVEFYVCDDSENFVGVAIQTKTSGNMLPVAIDAGILAACTGSVFAGRLIKAVASEDAVANLGSQVVPADAQDASIAGNIAGRAFTAGASGGFALIHIKS